MLILKAGILAVGSNPVPDASTPPNLLYYLIGFLVGYREETFRSLIKRLTDVILAPGGEPGAAPVIGAVNPETAPHNAATPVVITGSGLATTRSVQFGSSQGAIHVDSDVQVTATTPIVAAAGDAPLTVTTKNGSKTHPFSFT